MNKKNLMIGLTLILISVIGIIVPTMISNQSGAQPSRSQDGEVLLLSNRHIRSRRGYRFKYAGQFSFNTGNVEEELDETEDEEELGELDIVDGTEEQEEQINLDYQARLQSSNNNVGQDNDDTPKNDIDNGAIPNDEDANDSEDDDDSENGGDNDETANDEDINDSKSDGDNEKTDNENGENDIDDDDSKNEVDNENSSQNNDNTNNTSEDVESTTDDLEQ